MHGKCSVAFFLVHTFNNPSGEILKISVKKKKHIKNDKNNKYNFFRRLVIHICDTNVQSFMHVQPFSVKPIFAYLYCLPVTKAYAAKNFRNFQNFQNFQLFITTIFHFTFLMKKKLVWTDGSFYLKECLK